MNESDAEDMALGRAIRILCRARPYQPITLIDLCDDGACVIVGAERQRNDGASIDDAVDLGSRRVGIMPRITPISTHPKQPDFTSVRGAT